MSRVMTPQDGHVILGEVFKQATGQSVLGGVNSSNFVSVGEQVLQTGTENTLNAISLVMLRTMIAARPYAAKFGLINAEDTGVYSHRLRKISFLSDLPLAAGDWNTQLFTNLQGGFDNGSNPNAGGTAQSTASMWEQHPPVPLEMQFAGSTVWQDAITRYEYQIKQAFRSESEWTAFLGGYLTEKANDIEQQKESFARMTVLNFMAGLYDLGGDRVINLTAAYNTYAGTSYTSTQLRTAYAEDFYKWLVSELRILSDRMTHRGTLYHWSPTRTDGKVLLRHTPKDRQRVMLLNPIMERARTQVLPGLFNDQYLQLDQYEGVDFWQSIETPEAISVTPQVLGSNGVSLAGNPVSLDTVVGIVYDVDALMVDYQLDAARTTPIEARKGYSTTWYSMARNALNDYSENAVLLTMEDA